MISRNLATLAFAVSVGLGLCHALCFSTQLPDRVAGRFSLQGTPEAWIERSTMIDIQLTLIVLVTAGIAVATGAALRFPARWLNLPHRDWWLASPRIRETRVDLATRVLWFGVLAQLLLLDLFHRTVRVNLGHAVGLDRWWLDAVVFSGVALIWAAVTFWRYRRPATR